VSFKFTIFISFKDKKETQKGAFFMKNEVETHLLLYKIKHVRLKPFQTPLLGDQTEALEALGPGLWKR
jgi:hypothetical protein